MLMVPAVAYNFCLNLPSVFMLNTPQGYQFLLIAKIFGFTSFLNFFPKYANLVILYYVTKYFEKFHFSPCLDL